MILNKKKIFLIMLSVFMFVPFLNTTKASAAEEIYHMNATITTWNKVEDLFYSSDGKFTVTFNVASIDNHTKSNYVYIDILKKQPLGIYTDVTGKDYNSKGKRTFTVKGGSEGYYKVRIGMNGFTSKYYTITSIVD